MLDDRLPGGGGGCVAQTPWAQAGGGGGVGVGTRRPALGVVELSNNVL